MVAITFVSVEMEARGRDMEEKKSVESRQAKRKVTWRL